MLTTRQRLLATVIEAFGGANLRSFDERLLLQKRIYLLNAVGIDLGYAHTWYLRGPYCPALTKDAFACDNDARLSGRSVGVPLPAVVAEKIAQLKEAAGAHWSDARRLELLASVIYLKRTTSDVSTLSLIETLLKRKPKYKRREVDEAINVARLNGWWQ